MHFVGRKNWLPLEFKLCVNVSFHLNRFHWELISFSVIKNGELLILCQIHQRGNINSIYSNRFMRWLILLNSSRFRNNIHWYMQTFQSQNRYTNQNLKKKSSLSWIKCTTRNAASQYEHFFGTDTQNNAECQSRIHVISNVTHVKMNKHTRDGHIFVTTHLLFLV